MLSFWETFAIDIFGTLVKAIVKNPTTYANLAGQMQTIAQDILVAFPPSVPSAAPPAA